MAEKKQFDEFLGGFQSLPHEASIMKLVAARASEIAAMTHSIENPEQTKLVFQKLPVYMRRRVMSHNVKRLPRRLREAHLRQMTKSGLPPKNKRPSRKYRRKPRNLLSEYNRRQRDKLWLETHIWHAKRFHMIDKWGYRIASHPNDKCFKANYRAVAKHCLLQDISYYTCIEICGEESLVKETLKTHCSPWELSFGAKTYISGAREGTLTFFKAGGYPDSPIGNVHFFWKANSSNIRTIWIWVHPAFYNDFLTEIITSFGFKPEKNVLSVTPCANNTYINDLGCKMTILQSELNRFRLCGPLAVSVLTEALQIPMDYGIVADQDNISNTKGRENVIVPKNFNMHKSSEKSWHIEYYKNRDNAEILKIQKQLWRELKTLDSPSQLPPNIIIGLTVLDPRFHLPNRRTKCKKNTTVFSQLISIPPINSNRTPIWNVQIRRNVSNSCIPTSTINRLRSECLVPGTSNDQDYDQDIMTKIPILLIQKPGNRITGFSAGIDVIIPAGWAMPFWLAFLLRCTRVGALRESRLIAFESLNTNAPDVNDPDSSAYVKEALSTKEELTNKYFRYPPNRRVNFIKIGISSPFFCDWKILTKDWTKTEDFYVLRDRKFLILLQAIISSATRAETKRTKLSEENSQMNLQSLIDREYCLIRVQVSVVNRGSPKRFAIVCMPTTEDLKKFEMNKNWAGPVETLHIDPNESTRKKLRKSHLALLKRLQRRRTRRRKAFKGMEALELLKQSKFKETAYSSSLLNRKIISDQSTNMSKLYLPESTKVRYSCDREVMGYVTVGDISFSQARGIGIGYVTLKSLIEMINRRCNIVLVRNTQTRQYRVAKLDILDI